MNFTLNASTANVCFAAVLLIQSFHANNFVVTISSVVTGYSNE